MVAITAKMVSYSYAIVKVHIMYLLKSDNEFHLEVNIPGGGGGYSRNMVNGWCAALMGDFSAKSP